MDTQGSAKATPPFFRGPSQVAVHDSVIALLRHELSTFGLLVVMYSGMADGIRVYDTVTGESAVKKKDRRKKEH